MPIGIEVWNYVNNKTMENKQTAVEFAIEKLEKLIPSGNQIAIFIINEQAKQIEKEQIETTFDNGVYVGTYAVDKDGEKYYNETYQSK